MSSKRTVLSSASNSVQTKLGKLDSTLLWLRKYTKDPCPQYPKIDIPRYLVTFLPSRRTYEITTFGRDNVPIYTCKTAPLSKVNSILLVLLKTSVSYSSANKSGPCVANSFKSSLQLWQNDLFASPGLAA